MPSFYRPRRPRASPLWQIIHHGWDDFLACYEERYRKSHGPLRQDAVAVVEKFYRCGRRLGKKALDLRLEALG